MGTNKCLVKQLLCLYPFPHFSQRRSGRLLFRPSLPRGWPSLALRMRAFWKASPSSPDMSLSSSSMALSCILAVPFVMTNLWIGKLAGGDRGLPAIEVRAMLLRDNVFLRALTEMGSGMGLSPASWRAAATAATLALGFVMLLRRVTRWLALRDALRTECELVVREWDCRPPMDSPAVMELEETDGRWVKGREVCCISCDE